MCTFDCREQLTEWQSLAQFPEIERLNKKNKSEINAILGLNEENEYRKFLDVKPTHLVIQKQYPITSGLVSFILETLEDQFKDVDFGSNTVKDKAGNSRKITRILKKALDNPAFKNMFNNKQLREEVFKELKIENITQLLPAWGERKVLSTLVISTNVHDTMTPSDNSCFKSCHRLGGEYYGSAISHSISNCSFIAYTTDDVNTLKKIGRTWCFLQPDGSGFAHAGNYGTLHDVEFNAIEKYVEDCCHPNSAAWEESGSVYEEDFCGYWDSTEYGRSVDGEDLVFKFNGAICMCCGGVYTNEDMSYGVCHSCDERGYCEYCEGYVEEIGLCPNCGRCSDCCTCVTCERCNDIVSRDEVFFHETEGCLCEYCYDQIRAEEAEEEEENDE